jgi:ABC-type antimicrobial peptide transport system permease subunit
MNLLLEILFYGIGIGLLGIAIFRTIGFAMTYDFHVRRMPWSEEE